MADDRPALGAVLRCLVVGDSQNLGAGLALNQIDRAAQNEAPIDDHWLAPALFVAPGRIGQAESKLEQPRLPLCAARKIARPDMQVGPDGRDFVLTHALHGRRELLCVVCPDAVES